MSFDFGQSTDFRPLAARLRPKTIDQYYGQKHIIAEGKPLRMAIERGDCHSMILWGPPGTGKTTLAELIATHCDAHIERISAVTSGVKEIRSAIEMAKQQALKEQYCLLMKSIASTRASKTLFCLSLKMALLPL
jgi:putative ATPase